MTRLQESTTAELIDEILARCRARDLTAIIIVERDDGAIHTGLSGKHHAILGMLSAVTHALGTVVAEAVSDALFGVDDEDGEEEVLV